MRFDTDGKAVNLDTVQTKEYLRTPEEDRAAAVAAQKAAEAQRNGLELDWKTWVIGSRKEPCASVKTHAIAIAVSALQSFFLFCNLPDQKIDMVAYKNNHAVRASEQLDA